MLIFTEQRKMSRLLALSRATYRAIASKPVFYVTLLIFAAMIFFSQYITLFQFYKEQNMIREMGVASITLWALILVVIVSGALVTTELDDRTAVLLLSKPLRRSQFLVGKFLGIAAALFMGTVILTGVLFLTLWFHGGFKVMAQYSAVQPGSAWQHLWEQFLGLNLLFCVQGGLMSFLQAAIIAAVCVSLAAFFPMVVSVAGTALIYILGNLSSYVVASMTGKVSRVVAHAVAYVLPNFGYFNLQTTFSEGRLVSAKYLFFLGGYTIMYVSLVLFVAATAFEKREVR